MAAAVAQVELREPGAGLDSDDRTIPSKIPSRQAVCAVNPDVSGVLRPSSVKKAPIRQVLRHSSYDIRSKMRGEPRQSASTMMNPENTVTKPADREKARDFVPISASLRRAGLALVNGDAAISPALPLNNIGRATHRYH